MGSEEYSYILVEQYATEVLGKQYTDEMFLSLFMDYLCLNFRFYFLL